MRPGPWLFLLALLLSAPASAQKGQEASVFRMRTLLVPSQPDGVPPLELHVAAGTATLVESDVPLGPVSFHDVHGRIRLVPIDDHRLVLVPAEDLARDERLPFVVGATPRAGPLRKSVGLKSRVRLVSFTRVYIQLDTLHLPDGSTLPICGVATDGLHQYGIPTYNFIPFEGARVDPDRVDTSPGAVIINDPRFETVLQGPEGYRVPRIVLAPPKYR